VADEKAAVIAPAWHCAIHGQTACATAKRDGRTRRRNQRWAPLNVSAAVLYQPALTLTVGRDATVASSSGSTRGSARTEIVANLRVPVLRHEMPGSGPIGIKISAAGGKRAFSRHPQARPEDLSTRRGRHKAGKVSGPADPRVEPEDDDEGAEDDDEGAENDLRGKVFALADLILMLMGSYSDMTDGWPVSHSFGRVVSGPAARRAVPRRYRASAQLHGGTLRETRREVYRCRDWRASAAFPAASQAVHAT